MKKLHLLITTLIIFIFFSSISYSQKTYFSNNNILSGYNHKISGNDIEYHSHEPNVNDALLTRCTDGNMAIEWNTQNIPLDFVDKEATFTWIAGYSCGTSSANRKFDLYINNELILTFTTYYLNSPNSWKFEGKNGVILTFDEKTKDNVDDIMGNMFLKIPTNIYKPGSALLLKIVGEKEDSKDWYMTFKYDISEKVTVVPQQAIVKTINGKMQLLEINIYHINNSGKATIIINNETSNKKVYEIKYGTNNITSNIPVSYIPRPVKVEVIIDDTPFYNQTLMINPVTYRELCLVSHAHTDIGYSDLQQDVMQKHIVNINEALKLIKKTENYPSEAKYVWNIESSWAVDHFMKQATDEQKTGFINAVKNNSIGLSTTYNNILTGLCQPEELIELTSYIHNLATQYNFSMPKTMMINDVPGLNWSIIDALAQRGVKYIASGQNYISSLPQLGDRVGSSNQLLGDKPCYWFSPSGKEKVLLWLGGKGYSWFHGASVAKMPSKVKSNLMQYVKDLEDQNYPYDMVMIHYTIPADNGTTDDKLSDFVKVWNETYESPKLINYNINTLMEVFEKKYANKIPGIQADFTPYWEDGAISSAKEETMVRQSSSFLHSISALKSMLALDKPKSLNIDFNINNAWTNILMFQEHTWGAWNSISEPDAPFCTKQWDYKKQFEIEAVNQVKNILDTLLVIKNGEIKPSEFFEVFNPNSWKRTDIVTIPSNIYVEDNSIVKDKKENKYLIQHLSTGENIFIAKDIPAFTSIKFQLSNQNIVETYPLSISRYSIENQQYILKIDSVHGTIRNLIRKKNSQELVDQNNKFKLNQYLYVPGYNPADVVSNASCEIIIKDYGKVMASLLVKSKPAGSKEVLQEIRLYDGIDRIDIINTIDKLKVREKESIHFAFPFNMTDEDVKIGLGIGYFQPNIKQIKGSCKDYFCMNNWADVSNKQTGITLTCNDAPMLEMGILNNEDRTLTTHKIWIDTIPLSSTLFSYVMNNYWHTNYKADQEGLASFSYRIYPHSLFSCSDAYKHGLETAQPLIITIADKLTTTVKPFFTIDNPNVIITFIKTNSDGGLLARIYNASDNTQTANIKFNDKIREHKIYDSNASGDKGSIYLNDNLQPHEFRSILIY